MRKSGACVLIFSMLIPFSLEALSPVVVLGGGAGGTWITTDDETDYVPFYSASFTGGYRTALDGGGFISGSFVSDLRYYRGSVDDLDDRYLLVLDAGAPLGPNRLKVNAQLDSSIHNFGAGWLIAPTWSADLYFGDGKRAEPAPLVPVAGYFGSYRRQDGARDTRLVQGIRFGVEQDRSLAFGWGLETLGSWEYYPDWDTLEVTGETADETRRDLRVEAAATMEGLIGFFHTWDVRLSAGRLFSNANRWIEDGDLSELEKNSEDRVYAGINGALELSPHRNIGIELGLGLDHDWYTDREYDGDRVDRLGMRGSLRLDYTPNGALFFVLDAQSRWNHSVDPAMDGQYATVTGSIEYSF